MKETERGRIYLCAVYVGNRKEIKKEAQQISIQKDDIYGYIVETENGRAYGYPDHVRSPERLEKRGRMTRAEKRRTARQQEKDKVRYQLTAEEIRQIEKKAVESKKEQIRDSIMKEVREEWERREEMLSGKDDGEIVQNVLCLLLAVPVKVLCEKFKWKPYPLNQEENKNSRILKFSEAVIRETNEVFSDKNIDIRAYGEEVYRKYGIRYRIEGEGDGRD